MHKQMFDMVNGDLFIMASPDQPHEVFRFLKLESDRPCRAEIESIAFKMDEVWHTRLTAQHHYCNPYATGRLVQLSFTDL